MNPRTKQNLKIAMKSEACESASFSRFAAHARMDSEWEAAETFQDAADSDRIGHFAREAALAGLVADNAENIRAGIADATAQCKLYAQFETEATQDGDLDVARAFQDISREKASQCARLADLLSQEGAHSPVTTLGGSI